MPSFTKSIQQEVKLPIFDIYTLINMVYGVVVRKDFLVITKLKNLYKIY